MKKIIVAIGFLVLVVACCGSVLKAFDSLDKEAYFTTTSEDIGDGWAPFSL